MSTPLPAAWTRGPVKGKPTEDGSVRMWSAEDARRLLEKGEIAIPAYPTPFKIGVNGTQVTGSRCPGCRQNKRVAKEGGQHPLWCFGCGVWSAENAQSRAGRAA